MRSVSAGFYLLMISFGAQFREPQTAFSQLSQGDRRSPACRSDVTPRHVDCFKPVPRHSYIVSNATDKNRTYERQAVGPMEPCPSAPYSAVSTLCSNIMM